jgi:hypothetical protein
MIRPRGCAPGMDKKKLTKEGGQGIIFIMGAKLKSNVYIVFWR